MDEKLRPVDESLVNLLERFRIGRGELYAFPEFGGQMCSLDCFHVEVEGAGNWVSADGGIARICKGTGLPVAEAGDVVFISAEVLALGGSRLNVRI